MAADDVRPLAGRRIVVTRAPEQTKELFQRLNELGAQAIPLPMVRFARLDDTSDLDDAIAQLAGFDWIIFTSANAVRFFFERYRELGRPDSFARLSIAAVGAATLAALEGQGLAVAFVPREFSGSALAIELAPKLMGKRVLLPRSDRASEELPNALRTSGATLTEVVAYRTTGPESVDAETTGALCRGKVDAIVFFSPSAFRNFEHAVGVDTVREMGQRVAFASVGPTTAAAIRAGGVQVAVEAATATSEGLARALERHFARGGAETGGSQ